MCLLLTYMKFSPLSPPRLGEGACSKLTLVSSWKHQFYCGIRSLYRCGKIFCEVSKKDQCWILAQKFFVAEKSFGWNSVAKTLFRTARQRLSSTARVNAARAVQFGSVAASRAGRKSYAAEDAEKSQSAVRPRLTAARGHSLTTVSFVTASI